MEIQEVDVFVAPDGTVKLQVRGVQGGSCLSLTEGLEKLLGGEITSREMTPEADADDQGVHWQVEDTPGGTLLAGGPSAGVVAGYGGEAEFCVTCCDGALAPNLR